MAQYRIVKVVEYGIKGGIMDTEFVVQEKILWWWKTLGRSLGVNMLWFNSESEAQQYIDDVLIGGKPANTIVETPIKQKPPTF